jgi:6,7-dimethyl-8-ribityllumazine synthase
VVEPSRPVAPPLADVGGARFLVVETRYYDAIATLLLTGAKAALDAAGATYDVVTVPGALEIPPAAAILIEAGDYAGVIALGCIIRGETYHFEVVSNESARGIMDIGLSGVPVGNGILTVDTLEQARVRAEPAEGDKGGEAARAALCLHVLSERA